MPKELLEEDEIRPFFPQSFSENTIQTCIRMGVEGAQINDVVPNACYWGCGSEHLKAALAHFEAGNEELLPFAPDLSFDRRSECKPSLEVFMLYQFCALGRPIMGQTQTFPEWLDLRNRCRHDNFYLGTDVLHFDFVERVHGPILNEFFIQKDFDGIFPDAGWSLKDSHLAINAQLRGRPREGIILFPRAHFKTTADAVDCVSWTINDPDIRIFIITSAEDLAEQFLKDIKKFYFHDEHQPYSDFQLLFPEYVTVAKTQSPESDAALRLPCRVHAQKEPSLWASSLFKNLASSHCDIFKGDDFINEKNSNNDEARAKVKATFSNAENLCDEWGVRDYIGTTQNSWDWFSERIAIINKAPARFYRKPAWVVKPEFKELLNGNLKLVEEHMVEVLFAEKLSSPTDMFNELRTKLFKDEVTFRCQQLLEPAGDTEEAIRQFSETDLRNACVPSDDRPGNDYVSWDLSLTANARSDFSAAALGRVVQNVDGQQWDLVVRDGICLKVKTSELAQEMVLFQKKHPYTAGTFVERFPGDELLQKEVIRLADYYGVRLNNWVWAYATPGSAGRDRKFNAIRGLEILVSTGRIKFVTSGNYIDELFRQALKWTGVKGPNKNRRDDLLDAISGLQRCLPNTEMQKEAKKVEDEQELRNRARAIHDHMWGVGAPRAAEPEPESNRGMYGIPNIDIGAGRFGSIKIRQ
jgi:hypothetical protein